MSKKYIPYNNVFFIPPEGWGDKPVYAYFYYNDNLMDSPLTWPGEKLFLRYNNLYVGDIAAHHSCKVIITNGDEQIDDEKHFEPINYNANDILVIKNNKYTCHKVTGYDENGVQYVSDVNVPYNTIKVHQATMFSFNLYDSEYGFDNLLLEDGTYIEAKSFIIDGVETEVEVGFTEPGIKEVMIKAFYESFPETIAKFEYIVLNDNTQIAMRSSAYETMTGDEITITVHNPSNNQDYCLMADYNNLSAPIKLTSKTYTSNGDLEMVFNTQQLGVYAYQKVFLWEAKDGKPVTKTHCFVTINNYNRWVDQSKDIDIVFHKPDNWDTNIQLEYYSVDSTAAGERITVQMDTEDKINFTYPIIPKAYQYKIRFVNPNKNYCFPSSEFILIDTDNFEHTFFADGETNQLKYVENSPIEFYSPCNTILPDDSLLLTVSFRKEEEFDIKYKTRSGSELKVLDCKKSEDYFRTYYHYTFECPDEFKKDPALLLYWEEAGEYYIHGEVTYTSNQYSFQTESNPVNFGEEFILKAFVDVESPIWIYNNKLGRRKAIRQYSTTIDGKQACAMVFKANILDTGLQFNLCVLDKDTGKIKKTDSQVTIDVVDTVDSFTLPAFVRMKAPGFTSGNVYIHYYKNDDPTQENAPWPGESMKQESYSKEEFTFKIEHAGYSCHVAVTVKESGKSYTLPHNGHVRILGGNEILFTGEQSGYYYVKPYNEMDVRLDTNCSNRSSTIIIGVDMNIDTEKEPNIILKSTGPESLGGYKYFEINKVELVKKEFHRNYYSFLIWYPAFIHFQEKEGSVGIKVFHKENGVEKPTNNIIAIKLVQMPLELTITPNEIKTEDKFVLKSNFLNDGTYCFQGHYWEHSISDNLKSNDIVRKFLTAPYLGTKQKMELYEITDGVNPTGYYADMVFWKPC